MQKCRLRHYLSNYKQFKLVLDEARQIYMTVRQR